MTLLSRVAERIYWTGRYLERAENTARLTGVYRDLLLDLPEEAGIRWRHLVDIVGSSTRFAELYPEPGSGDAERFLVADERNPSSIRSSIAYARENLRTTRDVFPTEAWRSVNEMHLFAGRELEGTMSPRRRNEVQSSLVKRCQQIFGLLHGTMRHGVGYAFLLIGSSIERADMTTRVVDVAAATLLRGREGVERFDNALWQAVLRSLSAYQMYRQHVRARVMARDVIKFLLRDHLFPRALNYSLRQLGESFAELPNHKPVLAKVNRIRDKVESLSADDISLEELHGWIDETQVDLNRLHASIQSTWFLPTGTP
jgi:uncharacterized alpha-E superfamily protein